MSDSNEGNCGSLIKEVDSEDTAMILGAPWFRSVTVTLDYETDSIQIYEKANSTSIQFD